MDTRVQIILIVATVSQFFLVVELVRRRRLMERYALLWLFSSVVLVLLAVWRNLLEIVSTSLGIYYAPSALFVIAFGFVLILLMHFSLVVSRLADQNKILAQHVGLLREELAEMRSETRQGEDAHAGSIQEARATR